MRLHHFLSRLHFVAILIFGVVFSYEELDKKLEHIFLDTQYSWLARVTNMFPVVDPSCLATQNTNKKIVKYHRIHMLSILTSEPLSIMLSLLIVSNIVGL